TKTSAAPSSAPISGRMTRRSSSLDLAIRSSGCAWTVAVIASLLPGAALGVRGHRVDVGLVHETRAGLHRLATADGVAVFLVQLEEHDRQIALLVLLLVDREEDAA